MREENKRMKEYLEKNGIDAIPKYFIKGSMKGTWRIYNYAVKWAGNTELQEKVRSLGFKGFDGQKLDNYSGNGGDFCIFVICPFVKNYLTS